MRRRGWGRFVGLLLLAGCATPGGPAAGAPGLCALVSLPEGMCKHCNCLMPAGLDPSAKCPVCTCGRRAHECVRGY